VGGDRRFYQVAVGRRLAATDLATGLLLPSLNIAGKNAVPRRSSIVRRIAGILVRMIWLAACLSALVFAYKGYEGRPDWKMEEGLAFEMMALSFPSSFLVVAVVILAGIGLGLVGITLPASSRAEMAATWLLFVAAGYAQWFVIVPRFLRRSREKDRKEKS
jgi:hypothetical protein